MDNAKQVQVIEAAQQEAKELEQPKATEPEPRQILEKLEDTWWKRQERIPSALTVGVPLLVVALAIEALFITSYRLDLFSWLLQPSEPTLVSIPILLAGIIAVWVVTIVIARAAFTFAFLRPVYLAQEKLDWARRKVRFDKSDPTARTEFLQSEVKRVTSRIVRLFSLDTEKVDKEVLQRLECASQVLEQWHSQGLLNGFVKITFTKTIKTGEGKEEEKDVEKKGDLTDVEEALSTAEGAIYREEREQQEQQLWRNTSTSVVALYFVLLGLLFSQYLPSGPTGGDNPAPDNGTPTASAEQTSAALSFLYSSLESEGDTQNQKPITGSEGSQEPTDPSETTTPSETQPPQTSELNLRGNELFGIPLAVVAWSALGSIAAILFRLYDTKKRVDFQTELRWLIARPLIGIIMGSLAYLTIFASVLVISGSLDLGAGGSDFDSRRQEAIFFIFAFLGGFSEKFYLGIVNALIKRTGEGQETQSASTAAKAGS